MRLSPRRRTHRRHRARLRWTRRSGSMTQDQSFLMPPSLRDWLPDDHLALFVPELVEEVLDLTPFLASYTEARGFPPYHPRLMLKVLLYGYTTGVRSSRKIETRCHDDVAFRYLAANSAPPRTSGPSPASGAGTCLRWRPCFCRH